MRPGRDQSPSVRPDVAGLNRIAALGTMSASSARATSKEIVAVMPGRRARSELSTLIKVVYVTTLSTIVSA